LTIDSLSALQPLTLAALAACGRGVLHGKDRPVSAIGIDSRTLPPGALFVALKGERDGHEFAAAAVTRGAAALLVERRLPIDIPQVVVHDTLAALTECARARRRAFAGPVIGVTGSNGKTTTKEMLGAIVHQRGPALVTGGNLNNHIGVPLTLLSLDASHRTAVIEMGANHRGEIAHLTSIAQPGIGLVTNAGAAHLEGFGSLDGVAAGKGELFAGLPDDGVAVINADDAYADTWRRLAAARRVVTFGVERADFSARGIMPSMDASRPSVEFELVTPAGTAPVRLQLTGTHNLRNALGAAAAAHAAGATLGDIAAGLGAVMPVKGRLDTRPALNGAVLIDDTYNANPGSLKAGLDAFRDFGRTRWLILGDMMELGPASDALHAEIGRYAREAGVERLLAVGPRSKHAAEAFGSGGSWFENIDDVIEAARCGLQPGVVVLVKGSRASRLERVTAALAQNPVRPE
jgi:UDP-N-acetylmuramoyl-tripeptide--D-alanyl-D-alanine ligase